MDRKHYRLAPGIRVRQESFGLLFYNTHSTKLTFIESGGLIPVQLLENGGPDEDYLKQNPDENKKIHGILANLAERGLIHVQESA